MNPQISFNNSGKMGDKTSCAKNPDSEWEIGDQKSSPFIYVTKSKKKKKKKKKKNPPVEPAYFIKVVKVGYSWFPILNTPANDLRQVRNRVLLYPVIQVKIAIATAKQFTNATLIVITLFFYAVFFFFFFLYRFYLQKYHFISFSGIQTY